MTEDVDSNAARHCRTCKNLPMDPHLNPEIKNGPKGAHMGLKEYSIQKTDGERQCQSMVETRHKPERRRDARQVGGVHE